MTAKRSTPLALVLTVVTAMVAVQVAGATHPRPKSATPVKASLVTAYEECTEPNRMHGPPLGFQSCAPPVQTSNFLTVGTPDVNGAAANSAGFVRLRVIGGSPATAVLDGSITDVRCKAGATPCGSANTFGGPDYVGQLEGTATVRITDHYNGPNFDEAATVVDIPLPFPFSCASTSDPSIGSTCVSPPPGGSCLGCFPPPDGQRLVAEVTQLQVKDGGPDGQNATSQGNTLFMVQGIFIP
jgi:hypothetical protein